MQNGKMIPADSELFARIAEFKFDEEHAESSYTARLARGNGWAMLYAARVIEEYRKFVFLTIAAGHMAVPSDQVDQAWHQHLLYTRSWSDFCANVLRRPLHHEPSKGGADEQSRFRTGYAQTLQSYRSFFGEPPEDIWPNAELRFGKDLYYRRVNVKQMFVISRSWLPALGIGSAVLLATVLFS
jgi:hypothetical protein